MARKRFTPEKIIGMLREAEVRLVTICCGCFLNPKIAGLP